MASIHIKHNEKDPSRYMALISGNSSWEVQSEILALEKRFTQIVFTIPAQSADGWFAIGHMTGERNDV